MEISRKYLIRGMKFMLVLAVVGFYPVISRAQINVDCTGSTPGAFTSINAALVASGPWSTILVTGPCTEDVYVSGANSLYLGSWWGQTATLNGRLSVANSTGVYLYGLNISSATSDGITVTSSGGVVIDSCTSKGNAGFGMIANQGSDIAVVAPSAFNNNVHGGINLGGNSFLQMSAWNGMANEISNNAGPGVFASLAGFGTWGNTTISNNTSGPGSGPGFGVELHGGARAQFGAVSGGNVIQGNQSGGVYLVESSEIAIWAFDPAKQNVIQGNGPVGLSAGFGSEVALYDSVEISGHTGPALDLYGGSQAYLTGPNYIHNNGSASDPRSAGIRLDGNSQVFLRGGNVAHNSGPAILVLVNSSADFTGVSFASNTGGVITCDSSAFMVSDLAIGYGGTPGVICRTPHSLGNRSIWKPQPSVPDFSALKALQAKYKKLATHK